MTNGFVYTHWKLNHKWEVIVTEVRATLSKVCIIIFFRAIFLLRAITGFTYWMTYVKCAARWVIDVREPVQHVGVKWVGQRVHLRASFQYSFFWTLTLIHLNCLSSFMMGQSIWGPLTFSGGLQPATRTTELQIPRSWRIDFQKLQFEITQNWNIHKSASFLWQKQIWFKGKWM